ncbi:unnamed protein product, partial [marine sediment metagenome]
ERDLEIIPVLNKIDLPGAEPDNVLGEIESALGYDPEVVLSISAKTGHGVQRLIDEIIRRIPPPKGDVRLPLRALIFDSHYDPYKGVMAYIRVVDGQLAKGSNLRLMEQGTQMEVLDVGCFVPEPSPVDKLMAGDVGYIATGLKYVGECRVGDTVTTTKNGAENALEGYRPVKPMVFAGIYPTESGDYDRLRGAIEKLSLNDASLSFEPESSPLLGFGFRCGFLGLLHLDIVRERLEREFSLALVVTSPSVRYMVTKTNGQTLIITNPTDLPIPTEVQKLEE